MRYAQAVERPRVLITPDEIKIDHPASYYQGQTPGYLQSVKRAGGLPYMAQASTDLVDDYLNDVDGVIISGGYDVNPLSYLQLPHPENELAAPDFDEFEERLINECLAQDRPILMICRGLQLLNVTLGGSLIQHIPDALGHSIDHINRQKDPMLRHEIRLDTASNLGRILFSGQNGARSPRLLVNSYHHQGIDRLASGLTATSRSNDGLIESVEIADHPFAIGVQWHPEAMTSSASLSLFSAFISAARQRQQASSAEVLRFAIPPPMLAPAAVSA